MSDRITSYARAGGITPGLDRAALLKLLASARPTIAVITPVVSVPSSEGPLWACYIAFSPLNAEASSFELVQLALGRCIADPPDEWEGLADVVIVVRRAGEVTRAGAAAMRDQIIIAAKDRFRTVVSCASELQAAVAIADAWPGKRASGLLDTTKAEAAAAIATGTVH